jgi:di/tricarboxylate transporter
MNNPFFDTILPGGVMTLAQILLVLIVCIPLVFVFANRLRMDVAALLIAGALGLAQFLGLGMIGAAGMPKDAVKAISGFSQPVVITLLCLFIITRSLEKTGLTRSLVQGLIRAGGSSEARLIPLFVGAAALLSIFMNNLAAGALLLPGALEAARVTGIRPSKLLIPVAYGTLLGGSATYFTTANIIVSDLLRIAQPPQSGLNILDFTPTGGLIALAGIIFFALLGHRLLPNRVPSGEHLISRPTGSQLEDLYQLGERLWEARVSEGSSLAGKTLAKTGIGEKLGITVVAIWQRQQSIFSPPPDQIITAGDILLVVGREERVRQLSEMGAVIGREGTGNHLSKRGVVLSEIIPAPHGASLGKTLKELNFRSIYGLTAVALLRQDRSYRTNVADFPLQIGDTLLMVGSPERFQRLSKTSDFIVLQTSLSDQPPDLKRGIFTLTVFLAAIVASIAGMPVYLAVLLAALALLVARVLTMEEAYQTIEWQAIFLIAGMYTVSLAMVQTGLANNLGNLMVHAITPLGPLGLAAGAYLLTSLLTQVMGGQVSALVTGPVVISAAIGMGTSPQAIAVATAIGCSASFLTPLAHPVNILMIAPANYTFGDFFRVGWLLTIICFVMLLVGMVVFWGL